MKRFFELNRVKETVCKRVKIMKKFVAILLICSFILVGPIASFAQLEESRVLEQDAMKYKKVVSMEVEGKMVEVEVYSNLPFEELNHGNASIQGMYPEEVGTKRSFTVNISNSTLGDLAEGTRVNFATLKTAAIAALGVAIPTGVVYAAAAIQVLSGVAVIAGFNGVQVHFDCEYVQTYYNMGGYYVYSWRCNNVRWNKY